MIKAIVFDFDGVIADTGRDHCGFCAGGTEGIPDARFGL